jgi:protein-L-isoaspartate(D-aspartate) O-methyltransferase
MERTAAFRSFFAKLVTANAGIAPGSELAAAFASTPREQFVGPAPWKIYTPGGYIETLSDDPAYLYQDVVVSLGENGPLNNGQPTLHAFCLAALEPLHGRRVVHVGAGSGYYTTILAKLVGGEGSVDAYEVEENLGQRAARNLAPFSNVTIHRRSGAEAPLPACDRIYVNAGCTSPLDVWLDALLPAGRLLFPLTPAEGAGAMLLITKKEGTVYEARFLCQAQFVPCVGARDDKAAQRLKTAFRKGNWREVRSLHRNEVPPEQCWCSGSNWWLSTLPVEVKQATRGQDGNLQS